MFYKRHYRSIADILATKKMWMGMVDEFALLFRNDNPRFNEEKFRKACNRTHEDVGEVSRR